MCSIVFFWSTFDADCLSFDRFRVHILPTLVELRIACLGGTNVDVLDILVVVELILDLRRFLLLAAAWADEPWFFVVFLSVFERILLFHPFQM